MSFDFSGLRVKLLNKNAKLPTRNFTSAGYDLYSTEYGVVIPGCRWTFPLGIATEMPYGYFGHIVDRSGLAHRDGITVLGGIIDNDYRGEWKVVLFNSGDMVFEVEVGDRIAQAVFQPYGTFQVHEVDTLSGTDREGKGFGSSGA